MRAALSAAVFYLAQTIFYSKPGKNIVKGAYPGKPALKKIHPHKSCEE
jgi:hypothetical protein